MVRAIGNPSPFPKPLPKPLPEKPKFDLDKLKDAIEFNKKDVDNDQSLNLKEFSDGGNIFEQLGDVKDFNRYDTNDDKKISQDEYHTGKEVDRFKEVVGGFFKSTELPDAGAVLKGAGEALKDFEGFDAVGKTISAAEGAVEGLGQINNGVQSTTGGTGSLNRPR